MSAKQMFSGLWASALCVALGLPAGVYGFTWPASGAATIPAGETVIVTDADYDAVNALDEIKIEDRATNIFQTTKAPTTQITGNGAWVKRGNATWTLAKAQGTFYGSFIIEEGVVTNAISSGKGWPWCNDYDRHTFTIKEGAMFVNTATDSAISFGPHRIHIAGTGVNGEGVIVNRANKGFTLTKLKLDGDAKIACTHANGSFTLGPYSSTSGRCELRGHTLTVDTKNYLTMYRSELVGDEGGLIRVTSGDLIFGAEASYNNPFLCIEPNAGAFAMAHSGTIHIKRDVPNIQVPLTIESGADVTLKHYHENYVSDCAYNVNTNAWAGNVTVNAGAVLRLRTDIAKGGKHFRITGNVTGAGALLFPHVGSYATSGDFYIESPTNSFAGGLLVGTNVNSGSLYLAYSNSVPDYTKCKVTTGYVTARLTPGEHAWSPASLTAFTEGIVRSGETFVAMDARPQPNETASFDISEFGLPQGWDHYAFGADGGTVEISGTADHPVSLFSAYGTLKFTGEAKLTNTVATSVWTNRFGEMLFDGAKVVTGIDGAYVGAFPKSFYNTWPLDVTPIGKMRVRNSEFLTDYGCVLDGSPLTNTVDGVLATNLLYGAVKVGWRGRGVLEIEGNSVVSNRFIVGTALVDSSLATKLTSPHQCQYGFGAVYQRGGEVALIGNKYWGSTAFTSILGCGPKTFGYYEASGGKTILAGQLNCGAYGTGSIYVDGGEMVATNHPAEPSTKTPVLYFANLNYSRCALYVKNGGRFFTHGETRAVINAASGMYGNFTAAGEGSFMGLGLLVVGSKNVPLGNAAFFNAIDGGTIQARTIYAESITPETNFVCVCFNGGTFKSLVTGYKLFGRSSSTSNGDGPYTVVRVYGKGGAVDTAGLNTTYIDAPIKAAHGGGVASVNWTPRTGCQYPPLVQIIGDGYGASALAEFDSRSGTVTGVTVTSPGCGYTYAKAAFIFGWEGASAMTAITNDCVIAQNDTHGSFAKKGAGTLTLRAENSWGGDTILAGGVLKSGIDGAIPADGTFVLAGGTLDMNGTTLSDGTAMPKKWAVDVPTALTNGTITYAGNLAFPEGATMELRGSEALAGSNNSMTLLTVTGTVTDAPSLSPTGDPRWKAWWRGNSIRLTRINGTFMVIR
jgi:autotransporter-associated beta strand protein